MNYIMSIKLFNDIIINNIERNYFSIDKMNNISNINKIKTLELKYRYYKFLIYNNKTSLISIFCKSQKIYFFLLRKFYINRYKNYRNYNTEDLLGDIFNDNSNTFNIYIDKFIYRFTYTDFNKIINNSLLNYDRSENNTSVSNYFIKPLNIKNPYTNIELKTSVLYNFFLYCKNNNYKITTIFQLFYDVDFDIKHFFLLNENLITLKAIKNNIKNFDFDEKYFYLMETVNMFCKFLSKYIDKTVIEFYISNYKLKFKDISKNDINYYDNFIYYYLIILYYYKSKQNRNFVHFKLKLVMNLLFDNKIKFIDKSYNINYIFINSLSIKDIINIIDNNIEMIIKKEISEFLFKDGLDYLLQNVNNHRILLNNLQNDTEENSYEIDNEEIIERNSHFLKRYYKNFKNFINCIYINKTLLYKISIININIMINIYLFLKVYYMINNITILQKTTS